MLNGKFLLHAVLFWIAVALLLVGLFSYLPQVAYSPWMYAIILVIVLGGVGLARKLGSPWAGK